MSASVLYMSMSLDGYIAGPNDVATNPGGDGFDRLHEWIIGPDGEFGRPAGPAGRLWDEWNETGAVLAGRRTVEQVDHWGGDHHGVPIFVPSHRPPGPSVANYPLVTYVADGIASAMAQAKTAAGDRNVMVHGAYTAQRALEAGVLDELQIHQIPVLFGGGRPLFDVLPSRVELEILRVIDTPEATHIRYRVHRRAADNAAPMRSERVTMTTMTEMTTHTLDAPGATITYDVRRTDSPAPVLMLIGSPMSAGGFGTLASQFPDRTIVTYDPRGVERSVKADPSSPSTPDQHADDLHSIIAEVMADRGTGPVDLFASSGGAVNALALVAKHPEQVRTLVAHEPPLASILPDREGAMAFTQAISDTYQRSGFGPAMAQFILAVGHRGPMTLEFAAQPAPDPAMFGLPTEDDGTRTDPLLFQNITTCTHYEPDFDALRAASTRIVLAAGIESKDQMAYRGAFAAAERLGTEPVMFPSDHGGFLGGEYGQAGDPDAFAAKLREVLA